MTSSWVLAFHVCFVVMWFAGLFYLPRLFVYHAMTNDRPGIARFKVMEHKLYYIITTPGAILTSLTGMWLLYDKLPIYQEANWMHAKLICVMFLWVYHLYCGYLVSVFKRDANQRSHVFYRWFNEVPTLVLFAVVILAIVRPI